MGAPEQRRTASKGPIQIASQSAAVFTVRDRGTGGRSAIGVGAAGGAASASSQPIKEAAAMMTGKGAAKKKMAAKAAAAMATS